MPRLFDMMLCAARILAAAVTTPSKGAVGARMVLLVAGLAAVGCSGSSGECLDRQETLARLSEAQTRINQVSFGDGVYFEPRPPLVSRETTLDRLPAGFPDDLPVYPNTELLIASVAWLPEDGVVAGGMWDTHASHREVLSWYEKALEKKGWRIGEVQVLEDYGWAVAYKGDLRAQVGAGMTGGKPTIVASIAPTPTEE